MAGDSYQATCPTCFNPHDGTLRELTRRAKEWGRREGKIRSEARRAAKRDARARLRVLARDLSRQTPGNGVRGEDNWMDGFRAAVSLAMRVLR